MMGGTKQLPELFQAMLLEDTSTAGDRTGALHTTGATSPPPELQTAALITALLPAMKLQRGTR